jgi:arylsulfatase A-like enzyme
MKKNSIPAGKYFLHTAMLGLLWLAGSTACTTKQAAEHQTKPPNIIVILADDLGSKDLSIYGNEEIPTPHIDAIGKEGVTFLQGYSTAPICSPSRSGLLTGRYQQRFGAEYLASGSYGNYNFTAQQLSAPGSAYEKPEAFDSTLIQGLPLSEITLAEFLKKAGYATGIIGKWHVGLEEPLLPEGRGFDYHYGFYAGATLYNDTLQQGFVHATLPWVPSDISSWHRKDGRAIYRSSQQIDEKEYLTFKLADEATRFIEKNKDNPFFLYLPFNAPHTPLQAPKNYYDKFSHVKEHHRRVYYAMIAALDDAVGQVTDKLEALGLDENTLIVFVSDNGGATYIRAANNDPLRSGKLSQFEGGVRIPYLLRYKGVVPAGQTYALPVSTLDIFATVAAVTGNKLPEEKEYDGVNLIPYVTGENKGTPHEALFWRNGYVKAVRKGNWKLQLNGGYNGNRVYLFDLEKDPSETNNLADTEPEKLAELKNALDEWEKKTQTPLWKYFRSYKIDAGQGDSLYFPL